MGEGKSLTISVVENSVGGKFHKAVRHSMFLRSYARRRFYETVR